MPQRSIRYASIKLRLLVSTTQLLVYPAMLTPHSYSRSGSCGEEKKYVGPCRKLKPRRPAHRPTLYSLSYPVRFENGNRRTICEPKEKKYSEDSENYVKRE
jgi:hypothetical protein